MRCVWDRALLQETLQLLGGLWLRVSPPPPGFLEWIYGEHLFKNLPLVADADVFITMNGPVFQDNAWPSWCDKAVFS